jgi:hypothetical protein
MVIHPDGVSAIPPALTPANLAQEAEERISKPLNQMSLAGMQEGGLRYRDTQSVSSTSSPLIKRALDL